MIGNITFTWDIIDTIFIVHQSQYPTSANCKKKLSLLLYQIDNVSALIYFLMNGHGHISTTNENPS